VEEHRLEIPAEVVPALPVAARLPVARTAVGGVLMGLANMVPGVSGGTMIVVMGLYDEFIESIADITRLRLNWRNLAFAAILGCGVVVTFAVFAGMMSRAVILHRGAMYALFIGMTLGGAPLLIRMVPRWTGSTFGGVVVGLGIMLLIVATREAPPDEDAVKEAAAMGRFVIETAYAQDFVAGVLGMSAMVLPGISGAYMLLILGRYETILASIAAAKTYAISFGREGDGAFLHVLIPVAIGSVLSLVLFSNVLKWLLSRHRQPAVGALLGILFGSVAGIWPFDAATDAVGYLLGIVLAAAGFVVTILLSRIGA